jgi:MerR family transcriptional regulator, copper efflux regulator
MTRNGNSFIFIKILYTYYFAPSIDILVTGRCRVTVMKKYSIGEMAKISGVDAKTLRFYEEKGVIKPAKREENGYRFFTEDNLEEIKVIKNARELGLGLPEIKELMIGCSDGNCKHTTERNQKIIDGYVEKLTERIEQMEKLRKRMVVLQKKGPYCCDVLHQLVISKEKGR